VTYVDPLGLYDCLTDEQWPLELLPLCLTLDSNPEFRYEFYKNVIPTGFGIMGYPDAKIFLEHYLDRSGTDMWFGARLVRLVERDANSVIKGSKRAYLWGAAQLMRGEAGCLPSGYHERFLSNAEFIPSWYAPNPHRVSEELFIALGGFWLETFYGGEIKENNSIRLVSTFRVIKGWNFQPNTEMGFSENPPAPVDLAPEWVFPVLPWIPWKPHYWRVYFPDEWGLALEEEGRAKSFTVRGIWTRVEEGLAIDLDCDGWDIGDIPELITIREYLPSSVDPTPYDSGEWFDHQG
jgi:hypothetical protein